MKTRERRLIYISDPSLIASRYLPDPVKEEDLRNWIDDVAASRVDTFIQEVFTQGWTTYWRADGFDYDARLQHRRFLPLLDAGQQPFAILLDQCRKRGLEVLAGFRMNDNHTDSIRQGVGAGASFIVDNPQFRLLDAPPGEAYKLSEPLDFSFAEVRAFILAAMTAFVERFAVDGLEMVFRDNRYFAPGRGPELEHLMTELVGSIRAMLDQRASGGKRLALGCRVPSTIDECHVMGLDVPTWVRQGLVDYVSPADCMYAEFNLPYDEWRQLLADAPCRLYPGLMNWISIPARRRAAGRSMNPEQQRALATSMYAQGADGLSIYNHFLVMTWSGGDAGDWRERGVGAHAPFYPMALHDLHDLQTPERALRGRRHYVFDLTWGGSNKFGKERTSTGKVKAQRARLTRPNGQGEYVFRLYENLSSAEAAQLLFRAYHMTLADELAIALNGRPVPQRGLCRRDDEIRPDLRPEEQRDQRPYVTYWFPLTSDLCERGENRLSLQLIGSYASVRENILIEEVEVFVVPRFDTP